MSTSNKGNIPNSGRGAGNSGAGNKPSMPAGNAARTTPIQVTSQDSKPPAVTQIRKPEKSFNVYHHTILSCRMLTPTARSIAFVGGRYITDVQEEIEFLDSELASSNPYLSVVEGKEVMTATELDPMAMLRKKHRQELLTEQAEVARKIAAGETLNQSESEVAVLTPGSTADTANLAAGSDSAPGSK